MWNATGRPHPVEHFAGLTPEEVLYEFDGPRIYTCRDNEGMPLLVYECERDESAVRYLVVPIREAVIDELKNGQISVRLALLQSRMWVVDVKDDIIVDAWNTDFSKLPEEALPKPGTLLFARFHLVSRLPPELRSKVKAAQTQLQRQGGSLWAA